MSHGAASAAIVQLARQCDRGDKPPLSVLLQCLDFLRGLDFTASGGDGLLWMLAPVLRTAYVQLQDGAAERERLEDEVVHLRLSAEQVCMDVEHEREWLRRAAEGQALRCKERREAARRLEAESERLEVELATVLGESAALRQQADEGLAVERTAWGKQRTQLEEDTSILLKHLGQLQDPVPVEELSQSIEGHMVAMSAHIRKLQPDVDREYEYSKRVSNGELRLAEVRAEIADLERQLQEKRSRKGRKKK